MIIDKRLNLDTELEYQKDGNLVFAQNVVLSSDGLAIQNEPAIVKFLTRVNFDMVGFIACNEEFVLFSSKSEIVRINKDGDAHECNTNWKYVGGEVFGTFTYNVNNELIIAISERYLPDGVDCPLKVINLDRDNKIEGSDDNIYTLTPTIPKGNMVDIEYVLGDRIKKGKYNFFIKYFINDTFESGWFPIGVPIFAYDNLSSNEAKPLIEENVEVTDDINDYGVPGKMYRINIKYSDYYNKDTDYTNNNILLTFEINETLQYTHYCIGYIINTTAGTEGRKTSKININTNKVQIGGYSESVSVDELTIGAFNIYNANTLCNYKDRLYLANYKEENRNSKSILDKIDVSSIKVHYNKNDIRIPSAWGDFGLIDTPTQDFFNVDLKNQWKSKPGRFAVYNFFIHYVYPNGNYTDGIKIGTIDDYNYQLNIGKRTTTNEVDGIPTTSTVTLSMRITSTTKTDDILSEMQETEDYYNRMVNASFVRDEQLSVFCTSNLDVYWYTIEYLWLAQSTDVNTVSIDDDVATVAEEEFPTKLVPLSTYVNSKGEVLFRTPTDEAINTRKLWFTGIPMYPEFVGYFISYEEPEYIQIGEGFLASDTGSRDKADGDLHALAKGGAVYKDNLWRFYYPEFNIVGGKTNITHIYNTGNHNNIFGFHTQNDFVGSNESYRISSSMVVAPNEGKNMGKEGYLRLNTSNEITITHGETNKSFTAINNNYNIYLSDDKKLISLGYIEYQNYKPETPNYTFTYGYKDVPYNYDFYRCFSSIIFFDKSGIIVNQTIPNPIDASSGDEYYYFVDDVLHERNNHVGRIAYWHETHYPLFLKEINQAPESIFYSYYRKINNKKAEQYQLRNFIANPNYINDLYKLDNVYYDYTGKIYVNYDKNAVSSIMDNYVKTIRRSDVIQSESVINSWRYFRPENYKIITENKGAITNVVGIGNYLFAHCEHSLFLFDITDSLQALDKNVQLLQPDTFEVSYKEIFTSEQGYGGLQDFDSWICGEFGYVFYDSSSKHIYRFDGGKLITMNEGIDNFVKLYQPTYIFIGNDRTNNRLLFNFGFNKTILDKTIIDNIILSYSLTTNNWLSTHSYTTADKFISIKDKIFIIDRNVTGSGENITNRDITIAEFDYINEKDNYSFNNYSMVPTTKILATKNDSSIVDVIFTANSYNKIKVLDFITYIINKDIYDDGFTNLQLEIYTNCCYSGVIDISQERKKVSEYKKPYYDYERWNFNWFRNVLDKFNNGEIVNRLTGKVIEYDQKVKRYYDNALMTGKYAVIRFTFKNINKPVFIKDIHAYFKP